MARACRGTCQTEQEHRIRCVPNQWLLEIFYAKITVKTFLLGNFLAIELASKARAIFCCKNCVCILATLRQLRVLKAWKKSVNRRLGKLSNQPSVDVRPPPQAGVGYHPVFVLQDFAVGRSDERSFEELRYYGKSHFMRILYFRDRRVAPQNGVSFGLFISRFLRTTSWKKMLQLFFKKKLFFACAWYGNLVDPGGSISPW